MYGCTKVFTELLGLYYKEKHGVDFRSLRYPQVISNSPPGGGSGDCFVEIYFEAVKKKFYKSFLKADHRLPLIYIDDLIEGTIKFIEADQSKLTDVVYNV